MRMREDSLWVFILTHAAALVHSSFCFGVERQYGGSVSGDHVFLLAPVRLAVRCTRSPVNHKQTHLFSLS